MAMPTFTMRNLLEAGVHYGHSPRRWNPKMASYLFGVRNSVHIINLEQTVPMLYQAMQVARDTVAQGGRVLFVGTKRQASSIIAEAAKRCGQYYVNHRWLGGMMTNWKTVSRSIKRLRDYEELFEKEADGFTKKELLQHTRQRDKLERNIGGIKDMGGIPNLIFVIDTNKEETAIKEAVTLGIPVIGIIDSNSSPDLIDYPIPGNDDAIRAIQLYCDLISGAILDGLQNQLIAAGVDVGEAEEVIFDANEDKEVESALKEAKPVKEAQPKKTVSKATKAVEETPTSEKPKAKPVKAKAPASKAKIKAPKSSKELREKQDENVTENKG
jgi:small subunit ribosomal protein S2